MGLKDTDDRDDGGDDEPWFYLTGPIWGGRGIWYPVSDKGVAMVIVMLAVAGVAIALVHAQKVSSELACAVLALPACFWYWLASRHTEYDDPGAADTRSDDDLRGGQP